MTKESNEIPRFVFKVSDKVSVFFKKLKRPIKFQAGNTLPFSSDLDLFFFLPVLNIGSVYLLTQGHSYQRFCLHSQTITSTLSTSIMNAVISQKRGSLLWDFSMNIKIKYYFEKRHKLLNMRTKLSHSSYIVTYIIRISFNKFIPYTIK